MKVKKLGLLILSVFFFSNLSAALITHLRFEDNLEDSFGDSHNGESTGGFGYTTGIEKRGGSFNGTGYVEIAKLYWFDPRGADGSYSISMWVYSTEAASSTNDNSYIGKHTSTGGTNIFLFGYWNNQLAVRVRSNIQYISAAGNEPANAWAHYVVTAKESGTSTSAKFIKTGLRYGQEQYLM